MNRFAYKIFILYIKPTNFGSEKNAGGRSLSKMINIYKLQAI